MITYKTIVNASKTFADNHHIIQGFGSGELWQINDHDQNVPFEYPLMYMVDSPSSPGAKSWVYAFRIYFVSRVEAPQDRDGNPIYFEYTSEKSAMISCAQDFLSYWVQDVNYKLTIEQSLGVATFIDVHEDNVTGCYIDIRFVAPFNYDSCVIPMDGVPEPESMNVEIYVNDVLFYTVPPGTEPNIIVKNTNGDLVGSKVGIEWIVPTSTPIDITINSTLVYNQITGSQILDSINSANDPVGYLETGKWKIDDSTVDIQDTDGGTLYVKSVKAEGSDIQEIQNSITVIKDSANDVLYTVSVKAEGAEDQVITDSVLTLKNTLGTTIQTETLKAQESKDGTIADVSWTDSDGSSESTAYSLPIVCTPCPVPVSPPTAGLFIPISWTGPAIANYTAQVSLQAPNTYNTITRLAGAQNFDQNIFSQQTMLANEDWVISGDNAYNASASYLWGFGLQSITGINFATIDFCFFVTTAGAIQWIQSGVNGGTKATLTASNYWFWRLEYNGTSKVVTLWINDVNVHSVNTGYGSQTLVVKHCNRNPSTSGGSRIALRKVASTNRVVVPLGDSRIAIDGASNFPGRSYLEFSIAFSNHKFFVGANLAIAGSTTTQMLATQIPLATLYYKSTYTQVLYDIDSAINDFRTAVPLATVQANIISAVSTLKALGSNVKVNVHTVLPDFTMTLPDRITYNTWLLAGNSGADYVTDHTGSVLETNSKYMITDGLHQSINGTRQKAFETYPIYNSATP